MSTPRAATGVAPEVRAPALRGRLAALAERPVLVVGAIVVLAGLVGLIWTTRVTQFTPDELVYTKLAIRMGDTFLPLVSLYPGGGIDRLNQFYSLLIAPLYAIWGNATAYDLAHVLNSFVVASTAIPAYLLTREVVPRRGLAYLVALLTVLVPWVTVANNLVTEVVTYPAVAWACLAMQRGIVTPSARRDVLALIAIGFAAYARLQFAILIVPFVLGVLAHEVGWALTNPEGRPRGKAVMDALRRAARSHVVLIVGAVLVAAVFIAARARGTTSGGVLGFYGNTITGTLLPNGIWDALALFSTFVFVGVGVVPAVLGIGWSLVNAVRPMDKRTHAFACLLILTMAVTLFIGTTVSVRLLWGILQERYVFAAAPLLFVGMAACLVDRRRVTIAGVVVAGALVAWWLSLSEYELAVSSFWFYASPALAFFTDVTAPVLADVRDFFGLSGWSDVDLGALIVVIVTAALAAGLRFAPRRAVVLLVGVAVTVFCMVETRYGMEHLASGADKPMAEPRDWVDQRVPSGTKVGVFTTWMGDFIGSREQYLELQYWNRSIAFDYVLATHPPVSFNPPTTMRVDWRTGAVRTGGGGQVPWLVVSTHQVPVGLQGRPVLLSPDRPSPAFQLMRARVPYRAAWYARGLAPDGWLPIGKPLTIRFYRGPGMGDCRRGSLIFENPRGVPSARTVVATTGGVTESKAIAPGTGDFVPIDACFPPGERTVDVTVRVLPPQSVLEDNVVGVRLDRIAVR